MKMTFTLTVLATAAAYAQVPEPQPTADAGAFASADGGVLMPTLPLVKEPPPPGEPRLTPKPAPVAPTSVGPEGITFPVVGKFNATLYGFVELDTIFDSTQSFSDIAGNSLVARPDKYAGEHPRMTFSVRNSRLGVKVSAPEWYHINTSAVLEMDFLGSQPNTVTDAATFVNPTFRLRHGYIKLETPVVDVIIGQAWQLYGWQSYFFPASVEIQGVTGELYSRSPQVRVSKTLHSRPVDLDFAVAASRPGQRDSAVPDGEGGVRFTVNNWKTLRTVSSTSTSVDALSVGISGVLRRFDVPEFAASPKKDLSLAGWGYSFDAFIPIVRATADSRANALSLTASFARNAGLADYYTSLTGGVTNPALPNPMMVAPAPIYPSDVDPGLVQFNAAGKPAAVLWSSFIAGIQYYLPPNGSIWLALDYAHLESNNSGNYGAASSTLWRSNWASASLFFDLTKAIRLGAQYGWTQQTYWDGVIAINNRVQLAGFFIF
jgi:hypothetical protein